MLVEQILKSALFFFSVSLYFRLKTSSTYTPTEEIEILIKLLPIVSLMAFIFFHFNMKGKFSRYPFGILLGLCFSAIGDYYLIEMSSSESRFIKGVIAFAAAQLIYAITFGFKPVRPLIFLVCLVSGSVMYSYLFPGLEGALKYLIGVYVVLIHYMAWRAIARVRLFEGKWTVGQLFCAFGSILFIISDFLLGAGDIDIPNKGMIVMATYYAAQYGITMSVTDYPESDDVIEDGSSGHKKEKKKRRKTRDTSKKKN